jgi:hypothetical protein
MRCPAMQETIFSVNSWMQMMFFMKFVGSPTTRISESSLKIVMWDIAQTGVPSLT